jgi:hypothetical protein
MFWQEYWTAYLIECDLPDLIYNFTSIPIKARNLSVKSTIFVLNVQF